MDSTEVYQDFGVGIDVVWDWRIVGKLPVALAGFRSVTISNRVLSFGT